MPNSVTARPSLSHAEIANFFIKNYFLYPENVIQVPERIRMTIEGAPDSYALDRKEQEVSIDASPSRSGRREA